MNSKYQGINQGVTVLLNIPGEATVHLNDIQKFDKIIA